MKIVIEIPDKVYSYITKQLSGLKDDNSDSILLHLVKGVINGTVLLNDRGNTEGEWIKDYSHYRCSNCGKEAPYIYPNEHERFVEIKSKFCPNCGADMRGNVK